MNTRIDPYYIASKEEIIGFMKVIHQHKKSVKYCGPINNGLYLSYGGENSIFIYDKDFLLKIEIKNLDDSIYYASEKKVKIQIQLK